MDRIEIMDLGDGRLVGVEVSIPPGRTDERLVSASQNAEQTIAFRSALDRVRPMANDLLASLTGLAEAPDKVAVKFGLKLSASAGVIVAKAASEANFDITLTWEKDKTPSSS